MMAISGCMTNRKTCMGPLARPMARILNYSGNGVFHARSLVLAASVPSCRAFLSDKANVRNRLESVMTRSRPQTQEYFDTPFGDAPECRNLDPGNSHATASQQYFASARREIGITLCEATKPTNFRKSGAPPDYARCAQPRPEREQSKAGPISSATTNGANTRRSGETMAAQKPNILIL